MDAAFPAGEMGQPEDAAWVFVDASNATFGGDPLIEVPPRSEWDRA